MGGFVQRNQLLSTMLQGDPTGKLKPPVVLVPKILAAAVATCCQVRMEEPTKSKSTVGLYQPDVSPCMDEFGDVVHEFYDKTRE